MSIRNPDQRVGVFVDVQNLYYSARNIYNSRVNFNEVLKGALGDRKLIHAIAYVVQADMPEEHTFFEALEKAGFEVKAKELQTFAGGHQKGDWDVGIAMDIIKLMNKLDVVVLASGDGDFVPLLEYLQMTGQLTETIAFGKSCSGKVKELTDHFIDLDEDPKRFLMPIKGNHKPAAKGFFGNRKPETK
ncbi:MAG: NYN domain-containing protein [Candidatus Doudnabacteria bacterium]|nr:NYN domain-containing protein [Candidatus Doudnabacteria bacterium]